MGMWQAISLSSSLEQGSRHHYEDSRRKPGLFGVAGVRRRNPLGVVQYLPAAEPRRYLYDLVADYPRRGGRSFRPSLCIATARAFGTPMEMALRTAVSIEMMHNAMLIHDDVEDESEQRRESPPCT